MKRKESVETPESWEDQPANLSKVQRADPVRHLCFIARSEPLYQMRYKLNHLYPWSPSDQGQLNDNEGTSYNISVSMTVTNAQFFNMLNYVSQGNNPGYLYDINTNNCTTFVLNALQAGFVNISTQAGSWSTGSGYDPGDLGEDLRNMPLSPNMSRSTMENSHPNVGNCN